MGVEIAIVIGGGHNGLACAAYLAKAGADVLVLEQENVQRGQVVRVGAVAGAVNFAAHAEALSARGRQVVQVRDIPMLPLLAERGTDLAVVDLNLPDKALREASELFGAYPETPVLVLGISSPSIWSFPPR